MKKITSLHLAVLCAILLGSNQLKAQYGEKPQITTITGKIDHYDPNIPITISVKRLGLNQDDIQAKSDKDGNFIATFESYIPLDVVIGYRRTNFWVLLHPADSLFVHFDGRSRSRPELLESIKFGGDRAKTNQFAAK